MKLIVRVCYISYYDASTSNILLSLDGLSDAEQLLAKYVLRANVIEISSWRTEDLN